MTNITRTITLPLPHVTASEAIGQIEARGIVGEAARVVDRAQGGPAARHEARVSLAIVAALAPEQATTLAAARDHTLAAAWWRLQLEAGGVGGTGDCEGLATVRHPAFAALGKGRRQASDGPAWTSAIHSAAALIEEELAGRGEEVLPRTLEVIPNSDDPGIAVRIGGSLMHGAQLVPTLAEIRWWTAEARRRLVAAALAEREEASAWGALYNRLYATAERWHGLPAWVQRAFGHRGECAIDEAVTAARLGDEVPAWIEDLVRRQACPESLAWLEEHRDYWGKPGELIYMLPAEHAATWVRWLLEEREDGWDPPWGAPICSEWSRIAEECAAVDRETRALVADGLATKETRASGYVWRATHAEEPHPPASSNEPEESTPAPSNEVEEEEPRPPVPSKEEEPAPSSAPHLAESASRSTPPTTSQNPSPFEGPKPEAPVEEPVVIADDDELDLTTHPLLACTDEQFAVVASARKVLTKAREMIEEGRKLEERAPRDLRTALARKDSSNPAPEEPARPPRAPVQGEPREGTVEASVLAALRRVGPARAAPITEAVAAEGMTVERQTVAGTLAALAKRGLARRLEPGLYEAVA